VIERCRESFHGLDCARHAAYLVPVPELGLYPACERCAQFWAPDSRWQLAPCICRPAISMNTTTTTPPTSGRKEHDDE
jgi:hypothetical protein